MARPAACLQLTQLEATARGLIEELAASGAQATPRLRELLASGERLVAAVTAAGGKLAPHLPSGNALPGAPDRVAVGAQGGLTRPAAEASKEMRMECGWRCS